jgi:hypothetical protein
MVPSERSCGRGERVSTILGAHREKKRACSPPWRWGQAQRPARRTPSPTVRWRLRPARQAAEEGAAILGEDLPEGRASEPGAGGWRAAISPSLPNAPVPRPSPRRTPLSATLPHPAVRVQAALHCAPPCDGPLPRGCRGALGTPPAPWARGGRQRGAPGGARPGWRRQKDFYFSVPLSVCTLHAHDLCQCQYNTNRAPLYRRRGKGYGETTA